MTVTEAEAQIASREQQAIDAVNETQAKLRAAGQELRQLMTNADVQAKQAAKNLLQRLDGVALESASTLTDRLSRARIQALKARAGIAEAALAAQAAAMMELREVARIKADLEAAAPPTPPKRDTGPLLTDANLWKSDSRIQPRVALQAAIDYASDSNFYTGFTTDVSEGGVFIATVEHHPIGTRVDLSFTLPSGQIVQAQGEVRWLRDYSDNAPTKFPGMGVRFVGLRQADAVVLHQFVNEREPMFFPD